MRTTAEYRRTEIKPSLTILTALLLAPLAALHAAETNKPNIIVVLTDDHDPNLAPHRQGFDEYFTGTMQDYTASHALDGMPYPDAPREVTEKGCRVVLQTEWALQFLKRRAAETANRKPFFLYLGYMAPHTPVEFPQPWSSQVPKDLPRERRSALALIAAIDDGVGRVRRQLRGPRRRH
jgi:hypothetical protein